MKDRVIDVGEQHNPIPIIKLFDIGLLTSKSEGLSNVLIEYGAIGIPSVATDVGGSGEIVSDGKTGFLVPSGAPETIAMRVLELLNNRKLLIQFGSEAKNYVTKKFNPKSIIENYERYYTTVFNALHARQNPTSEILHYGIDENV